MTMEEYQVYLKRKKEPANKTAATVKQAPNKKGGGAIPHKQNNTKSKYSNKKILIDGITFDSLKEANRYRELKLLEKIGEIKDIVLQPVYVLLEGFEYRGEKIRPIKYMGDFGYIEVKTGNKVLEDTKGFKTKDYLIKAKLLKNAYPDIDFREL